MTKRGDRFAMPDGSTYEVTEAGAETDGRSVGMIFTFPPGSFAPPPHVHPTPTETFEVIEGELDLMVEGSWRTLRAGESASVPPGVPHTFKNRSGKTVRVANTHSPAARFEDYIEHNHRLLEARGVRSHRDPRMPIYLSMVMLEYPDTLRPSRFRERLGMRALAGAGRLFGLDSKP